jgi:flagellar motility protein MotE (MotC chaperone)
MQRKHHDSPSHKLASPRTLGMYKPKETSNSAQVLKSTQEYYLSSRPAPTHHPSEPKGEDEQQLQNKMEQQLKAIESQIEEIKASIYRKNLERKRKSIERKQELSKLKKHKKEGLRALNRTKELQNSTPKLAPSNHHQDYPQPQ